MLVATCWMFPSYLRILRRKRIFQTAFLQSKAVVPPMISKARSCAKIWSFQKTTWYFVKRIDRNFRSEKAKFKKLISSVLLISCFWVWKSTNKTKAKHLSYHLFIRKSLFQKLQKFLRQHMLFAQKVFGWCILFICLLLNTYALRTAFSNVILPALIRCAILYKL